MVATVIRQGGGVQFQPNSTSAERITVKLARIVELDIDGNEVSARTISSLAAVMPVMTSGEVQGARPMRVPRRCRAVHARRPLSLTAARCRRRHARGGVLPVHVRQH